MRSNLVSGDSMATSPTGDSRICRTYSFPSRMSRFADSRKRKKGTYAENTGGLGLIVPHNFPIPGKMAARRNHVILNVAERSEGSASQPDTAVQGCVRDLLRLTSHGEQASLEDPAVADPCDARCQLSQDDTWPYPTTVVTCSIWMASGESLGGNPPKPPVFCANTPPCFAPIPPPVFCAEYPPVFCANTPPCFAPIPPRVLRQHPPCLFFGPVPTG